MTDLTIYEVLGVVLILVVLPASWVYIIWLVINHDMPKVRPLERQPDYYHPHRQGKSCG